MLQCVGAQMRAEAYVLGIGLGQKQELRAFIVRCETPSSRPREAGYTKLMTVLSRFGGRGFLRFIFNFLPMDANDFLCGGDVSLLAGALLAAPTAALAFS